MEDLGFDPYRPPESDITVTTDVAAFSELIHAWEKLRLVYNLAMILPGLGVLALWIGIAGLPLPLAVITAVAVGFGANIAFLLGPLAELYLRGLLRRGAGIGTGRRLIFAAGLCVSGGVMILAALPPFLM